MPPAATIGTSVCDRTTVTRSTQVGARGLLDRVEGAAVPAAVGTLETEAVDAGAERGGCLVDVGDRGHGLDAGAAQLAEDGTARQART